MNGRMNERNLRISLDNALLGLAWVDGLEYANGVTLVMDFGGYFLSKSCRKISRTEY